MIDIQTQNNTVLLNGSVEEQDLIKKSYQLNLNQDHRNLVINCKNLTQINSLSIAWLIASWRYHSEQCQSFTLQDIPTELQQLIQLYRLDKVLRSHQ